MKFEKIRRINKIKMIVGGVVALGVISAMSIIPSFAKYKLTESINIANGVINYKVPDFQIVAMYKSEDGTNYTELEERMPSSGYIINEEKSYCNLNGSKDTNALLKAINGEHVIANLIKGNKCYLYFDKKKNAVDAILAGITINSGIPDFSKAATTDEGVYQTNDGMYGGTSYYWRGAVTNNYVNFAGFCWRIVRINGDNTIRIIYDGTTCHTNGTSTVDSIAVKSQTYNPTDNDSAYVGWTYTKSNQRPSEDFGDTSSNVKTQVETWYTNNLINYDTKIANGKFCNDRNTASGAIWSASGKVFNYAAYGRIYGYSPTYNCSSKDAYILKIGTITVDEAMYAGGKATDNKLYYLYNGQNYWTMTPSYMNSVYACVYAVNANGHLLDRNMVNNIFGIRPVINLKADITFSSGNGTINNPYEVK